MKERVALITGSSSGIGRGLALAMAERGASVVINYAHSKGPAERVAGEVEALGGRALLCRADVSRVDECRALLEQTLGRWGRLDYLVNNAGTSTTNSTRDITEEDWDRIFGVNVKGAFFLTRAASQALRESGGAIVNVSSTAGLDGWGSSIPYSASKAALNNLTLSLSRELAPEVRVNGVAPGYVETPWGARQFGERLDSVRKLVQSRTPLGRVNQVADVVEVILSLLTGMSQVTGQTVCVDGGYRR